MSQTELPWLEAETHDTAALENVFLHVTKACNLQCGYCYFSARKSMPDELTTEEFSWLWPELVELAPQKVVFTGGEPLTRPDLLELLGGLKDADPGHRVIRCLNTNGHLVTAELARELVGLADEVRVSLDGLPERNDAQRGRGNFDAAVRALDFFHAAGFEPKVLVTLTADTVPDLEELLCFLHERKITRVNLNGFRPIGRGADRPNWRGDWGLVREAVRRAGKRCERKQSPSPLPVEPTEQARCGVGSFLNIFPNGDVFPCHVLTHPEFRLGNLREQTLGDICRRSGLLGQLADLDFRELARQDQRLSGLSKRGTCLGDVYVGARQANAWRTSLPLLGENSVSEPLAAS